jgi:hypothetical protein
MRIQLPQLNGGGLAHTPPVPSADRWRGWISLLLLAVGLMLFVSSPTAARAEVLVPAWNAHAVVAPANLSPTSGVAADEVQEIEVKANGGDVAVIEPVSLEELEEGRIGLEELKDTVFAYNATHEEVQADLEGVYGAGNVQVSGGPGDEEGQNPYVVTFVGGLADRGVPLMNTGFNAAILGKGGTFLEGTATTTEITHGQARGEGLVILRVTNLGDSRASVSGADPVKISATLPAGVTATSIRQIGTNAGANIGKLKVACALASLTCEGTNGEVLMYESMEIVINVVASANAQSGRVETSVSGGGGAEPVSASDPLTVSEAPTEFGVESFEMQPLNADGSLDTQAGSHPFQFTTTLTFRQDGAVEKFEVPVRTERIAVPLALPKDLTFDLPPGLIGDPQAIPQCPPEEFQENGNGNSKCAPDAQLGVVSVFVSNHKTSAGVGLVTQPYILRLPVYNLVPSLGEPARFGFLVPLPGGAVPVFLDTSVRTGGDYGVVVTIHNISQDVFFLGSQLSFWGDPGDPRHDLARGEACLQNGESGVGCEQTPPLKQAPFLTLPASCTGLSDPFTASMTATTWAAPATPLPSKYALQEEDGGLVGMTGCNRLPFDTSISVAPGGQGGSAPTGLTVGGHVDQKPALNPTGLAEADVKDTTVTLPAGVQLSPSAADGLQSCSNAQIGFEGVNSVTGVDEFTPDAPSCPDASKVATVKIRTPLLPNPLEGAVYLAAPQNFAGLPQNPFESLVAMYIVAQDPVSGVLVKLPGRVSPDPVTGQIVATFQDTPQLPFEELELHFFGTARAPLATPALCGSYTTQALFTPSTENAPEASSSSFDITSGPNGTSCSDPLPFNPSVATGTTNINAGSFTPLVTTLSRDDGQQSIQSVELHYPPGLSGLLSTVKLCAEQQANEGTCGPESEIGETIVSVGLGNDPFSVTGGKVYITERYEGAPFGLSIVNPANAGPFVLQEGRPVVVRAKVEVDPTTSALTVRTDPSGPHAIPSIIEGIPLQIKHVKVDINRPGFTFNPTNCSKLAITATISSDQGASSPLSVPFQATNCASLSFQPKFSVSTAAKTSKANGASLKVRVSYPSGSLGKQANIRSVKVDLPKALPSRLTTLQKACTARQFQANPAACPAESKIGYATVNTPLLPVPLRGPVIFVSHGGEAFPSLTVVLQGDNVTIDLVGATFISKAGVTSTTFKAVPDQPFSSFELTLPQGKFSALASTGNLCTEKLIMPTAFTAQNGAEIHQNTPIGVEGCSLSFASSIRKRTLTLSVHAPAAGQLTASGKGLTSQSKPAKGEENLIFTLRQRNKGKLRTTVKVSFTPSKGRDRTKQVKSTRLTFKR